jgi:DNA-binding CsgD family transcriptional regulator
LNADPAQDAKVQVPKQDRSPPGLRERIAEIGWERVAEKVRGYAEVCAREPGQRVWFNRLIYSDRRWPVLCGIVDRGTALRGRDADRAVRRQAGAPVEGATLTPREQVVAALLAGGYQNLQIAANLGVSVHTIRHQVASILRKTGTFNRTDFAAWWLARS